MRDRRHPDAPPPRTGDRLARAAGGPRGRGPSGRSRRCRWRPRRGTVIGRGPVRCRFRTGRLRPAVASPAGCAVPGAGRNAAGRDRRCVAALLGGRDPVESKPRYRRRPFRRCRPGGGEPGRGGAGRRRVGDSPRSAADRRRSGRTGAGRRQRCRDSMSSSRSSRLSPRSTGSRFAAAIRPGCFCCSRGTASTGTIRRSGPSSTAGPGIRCSAHRAVNLSGGRIGLVYKCAEEIGELGDNVRFLRAAVAADPLLAAALESPEVEAAVLGHTRWASVGRISEANAHPLNGAEAGADDSDGGRPPEVVAAINGDIDNHADLAVLEKLELDPGITTDAKVMPVLMSRRLAGGDTPFDAFRDTVAAFEGSLAVGALAWDDPSRLYLAIQGSGQGLYVGLADHAFVVASEPYGLVEETSTWLRLDGEAEPDTRGCRLGPDRGARRRPRRRRWRASNGTRPAVRPCRCRRMSSTAPRSRPATSTGASTPTSCSRRSARHRAPCATRCGASCGRTRPGACGSPSASGRCRRRSRAASGDGTVQAASSSPVRVPPPSAARRLPPRSRGGCASGA